MIKLLLVDDDHELREMLMDELNEEQRFEITQAETGGKADEILQKETFDVVVTDIFMPPVDGVELVRRHSKNNKFIVMSGTHEFGAECIKLGAKKFFGKPFTPKQLIDEIEKVNKAS